MKATRPNWLLRLSLLDLLLLLLLLVVEEFAAEAWWLSTLITYAPQQPLGIPAVVLLGISILRREWRAVVPNLAALALFLGFFPGVSIPWHRDTAPAGFPLRVMTFNLEGLTRTSPTDVAAMAKRESVDVVCLQETNRPGSDSISPDLVRAFAGWHVASRREVAIISRYPIISQRSWPLVVGYRAALAARIAVPGAQVTVMNVHFIVGVLPELIRHTSSLPGYLRRSAQVRQQQAAELLDLVRGIDGPLLVLGDLNTPPRGRVYRELTAKIEDGFRAAGYGTGYTYPARRPLMRIDYVFTSAGVTAESCRVIPIQASDHLPVVADVRLAEKRQ